MLHLNNSRHEEANKRKKDQDIRNSLVLKEKDNTSREGRVDINLIVKLNSSLSLLQQQTINSQ